MKHDITIHVSGKLDVIHHEDAEVLRRLDALGAQLTTLGGTLMSQLDDLRTALSDIGTNVAAIGTNVGDLNTAVAGVDAEVKALIDLIQHQPPGTIPQDIIDAVDALKVSTAGLVTSTQAVEDQIAAIPPVPQP